MSDLFESAYNKLEQANDKPRGQEKQQLLDNARALLERATGVVNELGLFSTNETIDDVATDNLKYFLIPALLSKIALLTDWGPDRVQTLTKASTYLKDFMTRLKQYGMVDDDLESMLDSFANARETQDEPVIGSSVQPSLEQMAMTRKNKIEEFKRAKAKEERFNEIRNLFEKSEHVDEELKRNYYLALLKKWINNAFNDYKMVQEALAMERIRLNSGPSETSFDNSPPTKQTYKKPFTIVKSDMQKKVYGLGYPSAPTVTVDEFISQKINSGELNMGAPKTSGRAYEQAPTNSLQQWAEQPELIRMQDEEEEIKKEISEEKDDPIHLIRQRNWDDFKDNNPRGSGNRQNMG